MSLDNRHTLALPYWARPGILTMAPKAEGGKADPDPDDEDPDEDPEEEEDDDLSDLSVEELRAQLKVTQQAVKTANDRSARRRSLLKTERDEKAALQAKLAEKPKPTPSADPAAAGTEEKIDVEKIKAEARAEATAAADDRLKRAEVKSSLKGLVPPEKLDRALRLIDLSDLSIGKDGEVDGIDEALDELRADMPELFAKVTKPRRPIGGRDEDTPPSGSRRERKDAPKGQSASERQAAALLGR